MTILRMTSIYLSAAAGMVLFVIVACPKTASAQNTFPTPSGNVGIGTTSPSAPLTVVSNEASSTPTAVIQNNHTNGFASLQIDRSSAYRFAATRYSTAGTDQWYTGMLYAGGNPTSIFSISPDYSLASSKLVVTPDGNVGIGTTSPGSWGAFAVRTYASVGGHNVSASFSDAINSTFSIGHASGNSQLISDTGLSLWTGSTPAQRVFVDNNGKFGINATPTYQFEVVGPSGGTAIRASDNVNSSLYISFPSTAYTGGSTRAVKINSDSHLFLGAGSADVVAIQANGNVGIGTTSPGTLLDVKLASTGTGAAIAVGDNTYGTYGTIGFATVGSKFQITGTSGQALTLGSNGTADRFVLDTAGNVTLGGTINAKYQDVAEWVPASEQLSAGTVVVLDPTKSNQVTSSSVSYDTRVAGVVSEQPGIALGEKSDTKVLVATTGRVRVKVDASKGAIHIGDLLVTSDVPGTAMKSEPMMIGGRQFHAPGTLIGKALEPLEKGSGKILVLLSLQ